MHGVTLVTTKSELKKFVQFPYDHYKRDSYWVPPLYLMQNELVDVKKNPFYKRLLPLFS